MRPNCPRDEVYVKLLIEDAESNQHLFFRWGMIMIGAALARMLSVAGIGGIIVKIGIAFTKTNRFHSSTLKLNPVKHCAASF